MALETIEKWRRKRAHRKENRPIVRQFYQDGGDQGLRFGYELDADSIVLDLGGYEGQWASDLYARQRCKIHVFEPVERFADFISERFAKNDDIRVHKLGLGANTRKEIIHVCGASSSVYKEKSESETIDIVDVKEWLEQNKIQSVRLMKINIEGGEYELLERLLDSRKIETIEDIQVQFHNFTPDAPARMAAIQERLAASHRPTYQYRFVWENWQRIR